MEFYDVYHNFLQQKVVELEKTRLKEYKNFKRKSFFPLLLIGCFIVITLACLIVCIKNFDTIDQIMIFWFFIIFFPSIFFSYIWYLSLKEKAYSEFKKKYSKELRSSFEQYVLSPFKIDIYDYPSSFTATSFNNDWGMISFTDMKQSGLFTNPECSNLYNRPSQELKGQYKGVNFILSEMKKCNIDYENKYQRNLENNTSMLIITLDYNKKVENKTIVSTKNIETSKSLFTNVFLPLFIILFIMLLIGVMGYFMWQELYWALIDFLGKYLSILILALIFLALSSLPFYLIYYCYIPYLKKRKKMALNKVILEDPLFNKKFDVYSSSQVEARYHLTPAFMKRFYNLRTVYGTKKIKCAFFGNTIIIAIYTKKDLFEVCNLFRPTKDVISDFYLQIDAIFRIIDSLNLDEKLYLKE